MTAQRRIVLRENHCYLSVLVGMMTDLIGLQSCFCNFLLLGTTPLHLSCHSLRYACEGVRNLSSAVQWCHIGNTFAPRVLTVACFFWRGTLRRVGWSSSKYSFINRFINATSVWETMAVDSSFRTNILGSRF